MRTRIDPHNQDDVIWLQRALTALLYTPYPVFIGQVDPLTIKALRVYQLENGLTVTTRDIIDDNTVQHIQDQLEKRGLTIS